MRRLIATAFIAIAFCLYADEPVARLSGRVSDPTGGYLPGAEVKAVAVSGRVFRATSDAVGRYRLEGVPAGEYVVQVSLPGFATEKGSLALEALPAENRQDFVLPVGVLEGYFDPVDPLLSGELRRAGTVLPDTKVCARSIERLRCTRSDEAGKYSLRVPLGRYVAEVWVGELVIWSGVVDMTFAGEYSGRIPDLP